MTRLDDPALVAREYADDARLRRRAAAFTGVTTAVDARALVLESVAGMRPRRVLEVGCGWGELAQWVARETGAQVVAVDSSPHMVELAREAGVDARVGDVQELDFDDAEFDCAIAAWMLYHVRDLDRGIAELARVLRPGGRLVTVTNSVLHLHELRELVGSGPSTITFARENGEVLLGRYFEEVRRTDIDGLLEFANRNEVEEYVRASISMSPFARNLPATVDEPFFARRANSIFLAEGTLMPLDDPVLAREQYASEANLRARQAIYDAGGEGDDPREVAWEAIAALRPRRVLEVGGGQGELAERVAREFGAEVAFVDLSPRMVELARGRGLDAQVGDVQELPFDDASFDTAVAAWMLYHVQDLDRGLAELARVLEPGGRLVAITNGEKHLRELGALFAGSWESTFTRENGEQILRRHFARVERHDVDGTVTISDREAVLAYGASITGHNFAAREPEFEVPLRVHRVSTVFVATR